MRKEERYKNYILFIFNVVINCLSNSDKWLITAETTIEWERAVVDGADE